MWIKGNKYTVIYISSMMAMSYKCEITCKDLQVNKLVDGNIKYSNYDPSLFDCVYQERGKRKQFVYRGLKQSYVSAPITRFKSGVFEGWDLPLKIDTEQTQTTVSEIGCRCSVMRGNALYNFVNTADVVRDWVENKQLNPNFERTRCLAWGDKNDYEKPVVVFKDEYTNGHAVIDRYTDEALHSIVTG